MAHTYREMQPTDDSVLLRQYAENHSDEAFAELVTRHVNLVYSVALRHVGNPHNAEEITQAVFVILAKKAAQLRHAKALSSWLFQVTRLTATNFVRSEMRRHRREEEAQMQSILNEPGGEIWPAIAPWLDEVVAGLATAVEATGDVVGQRQAPLNDLVSMTLELRRVPVQLRQLPEHVRDVGVLRVRPRGRTIGRPGTHLAEPARLVVKVMPNTCPSLLGS